MKEKDLVPAKGMSLDIPDYRKKTRGRKSGDRHLGKRQKREKKGRFKEEHFWSRWSNS